MIIFFRNARREEARPEAFRMAPCAPKTFIACQFGLR
jgi:hypothetical protein